MDCTCVHATSHVVCDWLGQPSGHLCSPTRASGSCLVPRYLLGLRLLGFTGVQHGDAFSPSCSSMFSSASGLLPWTDWFSYPLLHLLALVVVLFVLVYAAAHFWRWILPRASAAQLCFASVSCVHFALAAATDLSWDGSLITRMIVWLVDSGASHHMVPNQDLLHNFVLFATKPWIGTAKAGQYSYAIGYGNMHQLLQTSVGEHKTVLCGVWCAPGLSSCLFSVWVHLKAALGNSCVLEFTVSALRMSTFTLPLVDDPSSGLFSFSGVAVVAGPTSALVSPAVVPPACSSKSTSAAPWEVWHHHLGHPCYDSMSQLKLHVHNFVVTGKFKPDKSPGPGCGCDTCVCCNLHCHPHFNTESNTTTASGQLVHGDGASGFPCSSLVHAFVGVYLFVDDFSDDCKVIGYQHKSNFPAGFKEYCCCRYIKNVAIHALKWHVKSDCVSELSQGPFHKFADENTITLHHSDPHEPKENSVVEHHIGVIKAMACAVSYDAGFWPLMWVFAMEAACLHHSLHIGLCGVMPHRLDYGSPPSLQFICTVGCLVYYYSYIDGNSKMHFGHACAELGVIVGFDSLSCLYKMYSLLTKHLQHSSEVVFCESTFPLKDLAQQVVA